MPKLQQQPSEARFNCRALGRALPNVLNFGPHVLWVAGTRRFVLRPSDRLGAKFFFVIKRLIVLE